MRVLFEAEIPVHYGFVNLSPAGGDNFPDLTDARAGQQNGLCGAAVPGALSMVTGLHTGRVPFRVEWHDAAPPLDGDWEEAVEVPFHPAGPDLTLSSFQDFYELRLPAAGGLRARFCAAGMDAANEADNISDDENTIDSYLLALWPAPAEPESILRETSEIAAYWHGVARSPGA
jgi:hypothetical protein